MTTPTKHPRMLEAIENAKVAAVSNRGIYPVTAATNVFYTDGTPLEEPPVVEDTTTEEGTEDAGADEGTTTTD